MLNFYSIFQNSSKINNLNVLPRVDNKGSFFCIDTTRLGLAMHLTPEYADFMHNNKWSSKTFRVSPTTDPFCLDVL